MAICEWRCLDESMIFNGFVRLANGDVSMTDCVARTILPLPSNALDDNLSQKVHKSITRVLRKSYVHKLVMQRFIKVHVSQPMAMGFLKETGLDRYDKVQLRTNEGKIWKVGVTKYGKIRFLTQFKIIFFYYN
ncbi:hypothetical protein LXL04_028676 [Taraxacum kok-saghyz]